MSLGPHAGFILSAYAAAIAIVAALIVWVVLDRRAVDAFARSAGNAWDHAPLGSQKRGKAVSLPEQSSRAWGGGAD